MDELDDLFGLFNRLLARNSKASHVQDIGHTGELSHAFFDSMIRYYGFDAMPQVYVDAEFDGVKLPKLYHEFSNEDDVKKFLTGNDKLFMSSFMYDGFYLSDKNYNTPLTFSPFQDYLFYGLSELINAIEPSQYLPVKVVGGTMILSSDLMELVKQLKHGNIQVQGDDGEKIIKLLRFATTIDNPKTQKKFIKAFIDNPSNLAVYLGYSFMICDRFEERDCAFVFDRSKLAVSEKDYIKYTGKRKDGSDFDGGQMGE